MVLNGEHSCDKCNEKFKWYYTVPKNNQESPFDREEPPKGCQQVFYISKVNEEKFPVGGVAKCPSCNRETAIQLK